MISKKFVDRTGHDVAQLYITHRRRAPQDEGEAALWTYRAPGRSFTTGTIENSCVVPYSSRLSILFQCHLNVELCVSRVCGIKYLVETVCKGNDCLTVQFMHGQQH